MLHIFSQIQKQGCITDTALHTSVCNQLSTRICHLLSTWIFKMHQLPSAWTPRKPVLSSFLFIHKLSMLCCEHTVVALGSVFFPSCFPVSCNVYKYFSYRKGHLHLAECLVTKFHCDVWWKNKQGKTPLQLAWERKYVCCLKPVNMMVQCIFLSHLLRWCVHSVCTCDGSGPKNCWYMHLFIHAVFKQSSKSSASQRKCHPE